MPSMTDPKIAFLSEPLRLYIDGTFVETEQTLPTLNPATGEVLADAPLATAREVGLAVDAAQRAFDDWRFLPPTKRARLIWRLAEVLEENAEELATLEVLDNGKPLGEAQAVDIALTIELLRYYAGWPTKMAGGVLPNSIPGMLTLNKREPVGVVAAITPWNFPLLEVAYKLGPGLAAGCTFVIKPSELAPLSTLRLMKRVTLELGGKSPNIVFADADLDAASSGAFGGIFFNQGEACVAGSRLFVETPVADELVARVSDKARKIRLGHGLHPETEMGPLISANHRKRVLGYVGSAVADGASVEVGGEEATVDGLEGGFFVQPTVVTGVRNEMRIAQEEVFGPVLAVIPFSDEDELRTLANGVEYGLAAGIWTRNTSRALRLADLIDAGTVWINTYGMFDVAVPFGGRKHSGFGRELGEEALEPYLKSKSVWVDLTPVVPQAGQGIGR